MNPGAGSFQPLLNALAARNYHFVTPTPATHARVIARKREAQDLRDVFGWSLPFRRELLEPEIVETLQEAGALDAEGALWRSRIRVSSLDQFLFIHSAYPTTQRDAVFFGPDSYRFAAFIRRELLHCGPVQRLADVGAGSGVGAVVAMRTVEVAKIAMTDINSLALRYAMENVIFASRRMPSGKSGVAVDFRESPGLKDIDGPLDVVIANPPYIMDPMHRAYRDGGGALGTELSLAWTKEAAEKLRPGGRLLLYTGSAIVGGEDRLERSLRQALPGFDIRYEEIDPDVFGEELEREDYADVDRIAVVGVVAVKR